MDIMGFLVKTLDPPWSYFLITIGLLLVIVPKFLDIRRELINTSKDRRNLIRKKEKLELLKLQFEIEALRSQYDLPVSESVSSLLTPEVVEIPAPELSSEEVKIPVPEVPTEEEVKRVMPAKARLSSFLLAVVQVVLVFIGAFFAIESVMNLFIDIKLYQTIVLMEDVPGKSITVGWGWEDYALTILASLVYVLVTWGAFKGYMRLRRIRNRIRHVS
jgi:hypothetical protein